MTITIRRIIQKQHHVKYRKKKIFLFKWRPFEMGLRGGSSHFSSPSSMGHGYSIKKAGNDHKSGQTNPLLKKAALDLSNTDIGKIRPNLDKQQPTPSGLIVQGFCSVYRRKHAGFFSDDSVLIR